MSKLQNSLCLLIPTIIGREQYLKRLLDILQPQMDLFKGFVNIIIESDNREKTIGEKRNILMQKAIASGTTHRAFIDDDDTVSNDYLKLNMPGVFANYDCNSLMGIYTLNGWLNPEKHIFIHSIKYPNWFEDEQYYYRNPNHLNVIKIDLIKDIKFQEKNFGEDGCWSEDLVKANVLKNEYEIKKPFYNYLCRTKKNNI